MQIKYIFKLRANKQTKSINYFYMRLMHINTQTNFRFNKLKIHIKNKHTNTLIVHTDFMFDKQIHIKNKHTNTLIPI